MSMSKAGSILCYVAAGIGYFSSLIMLLYVGLWSFFLSTLFVASADPFSGGAMVVVWVIMLLVFFWLLIANTFTLMAGLWMRNPLTRKRGGIVAIVFGILGGGGILAILGGIFGLIDEE